jgi:PadR family transcriptional regulator, regulatory protein AphA
LSLRHGLLGLLAEKPMSGYDLTAAFDSSLRYVWSARHSQIYPELSKLLADGLIEQVEEGPRRRKAYGLTASGLEELRFWLLHVAPNRGEKDEASLKFFFLWTLTRAEALELLSKEREFHINSLKQYVTIAEHLRDAPWGQLPIQLGISYERHRIRWLDWALKEIKNHHRRRPVHVHRRRAAG